MDGLSDDQKIEYQSDIAQRVNEELADVNLMDVHLRQIMDSIKKSYGPRMKSK